MRASATTRTSDGKSVAVATLLPPREKLICFEVTILQDIECHLATTHLALAGEPWTVISNVVPSCKPLKSIVSDLAASNPILRITNQPTNELSRSHLRDTQALNCLFMLLAAATMTALAVAVVVVGENRRNMLDWHDQRGLSFLQLGLRAIKRLCCQHLPIPRLATLPRNAPESLAFQVE